MFHVPSLIQEDALNIYNTFDFTEVDRDKIKPLIANSMNTLLLKKM